MAIPAVSPHSQCTAGPGLAANRGCDGRSIPLIADVELLRVHLGVDRWVVAGWSWGRSRRSEFGSVMRYPKPTVTAALSMPTRGCSVTATKRFGNIVAGVGHSAAGAMSELGVDALDRFAAL